MSRPPKIIAILQNTPEPAAQLALAAGLPYLDDEMQCQIIGTILARPADQPLEPLAEVFDRLASRAQTAVIANVARLFSALRLTVKSPSLQTRLNSLNIIRRSRNPRLAYLAAAAVNDGSHHIRAEAAQTLRELAELHCANHVDTTDMLRDASDGGPSLGLPVAQTLRLLRDERQQLVSAIREALSNFESHHRQEVLEAGMFLVEDVESSLFQSDTLKRGKLTQAILEAYSHSPSPRLAAFTYFALKHPELRRRITAILAQLKNPDFFAEFIRCHWLARDPEIRKNLASIRSINWLNDGLEAAFTLPPHIAAVAPTWLLHLGLPNDQKVRLLMSFLLIDNPEANLAAAWALTRIRTPGAMLALHGACDHEDARVRAIAQEECRHRRSQERNLVRQTRRNRPADWSDLLDRSGLTETFEDFWLNFDHLPVQLANAAGPHALKFIPALQTQVQVKLIAPHPADRLRALKMLEILNITSRFCKEVFSAANDASADVRAAAIRTLGRLGDQTSRRILERALTDSAPSVQAAAIEALDLIAFPKRVTLFLPKVASDDAPVRAAAVHALLKMHLPQAAHALVAMLQDERTDHRFHALWIVEQLKLSAIAPRVAQIADSDPDPRIARIAQQIHRRLERGAAQPPDNRLTPGATQQSMPTGAAQ